MVVVAKVLHVVLVVFLVDAVVLGTVAVVVVDVSSHIVVVWLLAGFSLDQILQG